MTVQSVLPVARYIASGENATDQTCKLWSIASNNCIKTLTEHENALWSVAFSPDAMYLATGSTDCTVKLWNVETGNCLQTLAQHSD
ncbi:MAG: hypothetical protein AAFY67_16215, partial [Cyanobacteria bacterium J06642_9]